MIPENPMMIDPQMSGVTEAQLLDDALENAGDYSKFWRAEYTTRVRSLVELSEDHQEYDRTTYRNAIFAFAQVMKINDLAADLMERASTLLQDSVDYAGVGNIFTQSCGIIKTYKALYKAAAEFGI